MTAVALESEGYTGSVLRRASAGGKFILYIAPLQEEIDLTPLPVDSPEFSLIPKATCPQCKKVTPLQMLALHVQGGCEGTSRTTLCDSEVTFFHLMQVKGECCHEASRLTFFKPSLNIPEKWSQPSRSECKLSEKTKMVLFFFSISSFQTTKVSEARLSR